MVPPNQLFDEDVEPSRRSDLFTESGDLAAQIKSLEARLDGLIRRSAELRTSDPEPDDRTPRTPGVEPIQVAPQQPAAMVNEPVTELSGNSYSARQWGRAGMRSRVEEIDDFGLDPDFEQKIQPFAQFLYKRYFRTQVEGINNIPSEGRAVIVANHSGTLPLDGLMLRTAIRAEHAARRDLRWLAEDFIFFMPFAGVFMNRVGAVRACQENAERLLTKESLVAVFPEGIQGIKKLFRERYRLQRFGRGGYIRLCLRMQAPLIPCAVIGAEEASPLLYRIERLSELVGLPYIPITPTFPLLGPAGLIPAPSKWKIKFGEPIYLDSYGPEAADDHVLVGRLSERVRTAIQSMLDNGVRERRSIWFG
jgi:1-acyl-sn-glycerol-3-phosphate acyltransferase